MDISVIICTYNRCSNLPACLAALEKQEGVENLVWEVVLVDNNSCDGTALWAGEYAKKTPLHFRYTLCQEQGLSNARNHGIQAAKGDILIFIDDDIRVSPGWLKAYAEIFQAHDIDAAGGKIHLLLPANTELPPWINPEMRGFLGYRDFGETAYRLDGMREFPFGGNMAIHRRAFNRIGRFDPRLGRKGEGKRQEELFKGEETDFFHRLARAGGKIWYQPSALVYHLVLPHQLTRCYFLTLHYNAGVQQARYGEGYSRRLFGVPRFLYRQWLKAIARYLGQTLRFGINFSFRQLMNVAYFTGMIHEYRSQSQP